MGFRELLFGSRSAPEQRSQGPSFSISDPALAEYLGITGSGVAGISVTDQSALGVTAFWRGVNIVAGTIAGLPLRTYQRVGTGKVQIPSWLDDPAEPYPLTPFAWTELAMVHMLIRGESFLRHTYNAAGALIGTWPIHPAAVSVKWAGASKVFRVTEADGTQRDYTPETMTQVMGLSLDGLRGCSVLTLMRHPISLGIANEKAAGRTIGNGMTIAGLVTPEVDMEEEDAKKIKAGLSAKLTGVENAGDIAVVNRALKFTPWAMSAVDAQFLESREFQVIEFARILGIPPHLLGATEKQTSWGTGVAEQNLGLARYTLMGFTSRLEQALSRLMPPGQFAEFDYAGLLQGSPAAEIGLLIEQVEAGLLTVDEARAIRNLPPLPKPSRPAIVPPAAEDAA